MLNIPIYDKYNGEKKIAMLDNSTILFVSFLFFRENTIITRKS